MQLIAACMDGWVFLSINPSYLSIDEKKIVQITSHIHVTNLLCFVFVSKQNTKGWSHVCDYQLTKCCSLLDLFMYCIVYYTDWCVTNSFKLTTVFIIDYVFQLRLSKAQGVHSTIHPQRLDEKSTF